MYSYTSRGPVNIHLQYVELSAQSVLNVLENIWEPDSFTN